LAKSLNFPQDVATKSGTSNESKRLNFVGFKYKSLSVFVTIAKDNNQKFNALSSQAGLIARDIWRGLKEGDLD
jgi:membrane carboxypeptidase/penicillin-binding protein